MILQELFTLEIYFGKTDQAIPENNLIRHFGTEAFCQALACGDIRARSIPCAQGGRCCWLTEQGRSKVRQGYH